MAPTPLKAYCSTYCWGPGGVEGLGLRVGVGEVPIYNPAAFIHDDDKGLNDNSKAWQE